MLAEREAAGRATSPRAAEIHRDLAERYEAVLRAYGREGTDEERDATDPEAERREGASARG